LLIKNKRLLIVLGKTFHIPFGFIAAAISGYFFIKHLLRYLQKNSTDLFVCYRWGLAIMIIIIAIVRR
jgi:undecaprenyl pyrophosphate phosphatase UppP